MSCMELQASKSSDQMAIGNVTLRNPRILKAVLAESMISNQKEIMIFYLFCAALFVPMISGSDLDSEIENSSFQIEGKVTPPDPKPKDWYWSTRIYIDGGRRMAYIKVSPCLYF